jgi:hypothetical protein
LFSIKKEGKQKMAMDDNTRARIERDFTYQAPDAEQAAVYTQIRDKAKELALLIAELVPSSREMSLSLTAVEQAVMYANAGIARNN